MRGRRLSKAGIGGRCRPILRAAYLPTPYCHPTRILASQCLAMGIPVHQRAHSRLLEVLFVLSESRCLAIETTADLRMNFPSPARPTHTQVTTSVSNDSAISPKSRLKALPIIINTDSSPQRSDASSQGGPSRPERSPTRSVSSIHSSATINDLTEMLGGAIDAIGLIDSRDTPPPTIMEPKKDRGLSVPTLSAPAEVIEAPKNLPARGASLPGTTVPSARMQPIRQVSGGSVSSMQEYHMIQGVPTARPWPAAMMYGGIKRLRAPGDRAKAYAKAINDLSKAESGLREWCQASSKAPSPHQVCC